MELRPVTLATDWSALAGAEGPALFVPALARFPAAVRELMALLPVTDINGSLIRTLADAPGQAPGSTVAGLFAVDPFLDPGELRAALRRAGIGRVANYPTVQLFDGATAAGFEVVGYDVRAEFALLRSLADSGLDPVGYVTSPAIARIALDAGCRTLVVHPGLGPGSRLRGSSDQIAELAAESGAALYRHALPAS